MDYSITDLMKAASMMSKKYFGRQDEYTISFTKEHTKIKGLCPVTLFVLGQYPDYMWIKPMNLSEEKKQSLGLH